VSARTPAACGHVHGPRSVYPYSRRSPAPVLYGPPSEAVRQVKTHLRPTIRAPKLSFNRSQLSAAFQCFQHGNFIRVFQVRANRNPYANARDAHSQRLE
jgi:hypothetical protein